MYTSQQEKKLEQKLEETYGMGYKLLKLSGYKIGHGLGAKEQGITDPLEIKKRTGNAGIKTNDEYINPLSTDPKNNYILGHKRLKQQKLNESLKAELSLFNTIIHEYKTNPSNESYITKLLTQTDTKSDNDINISTKLNSNHLLNKTLNISTLSTISVNPNETLNHLFILTKNKIRNYIHKYYSISNNKELYSKLSNTNNNDNSYTFQQCEQKEKLLTELTDNISKYNSPFNNETKHSLKQIEQFILNYIELLTQCEHIYKYTYNHLTLYCINKVIESFNEITNTIPSLKWFLQNENITAIQSISTLLKELLIKTYDEYNDDNYSLSKSSKYYGMFIYQILVNTLIQIINTSWNVLEYQQLMPFIESYQSIFPKYFINHISKAISSKITTWLCTHYSFLPDKDNLNVHLWIIPWFDIMSMQYVNEITFVIQEKIRSNIIQWNIESVDVNKKLVSLLLPWLTLFESSFWKGLYKEFFIPKLMYIFDKMNINPRDQSLKEFEILFELNDKGIVTADKCMVVLKEKFFPKLISVLDHWLKIGELTNDKKEEIEKWYKGWKELMKNNYLKYEEIKNEFKDALILIYSYTKNK